MPKRHFDLAVIGGGSAGLTSALMGARLGARVLLVDREALGGDCLHYGCVPSKSLIASARQAHRMRHASRYGLSDVEPTVDIVRVLDRVRAVQAEIGAHETPEALSEQGVEVQLGGARFLDPHTLQVGGQLDCTADKIVIATGARAFHPTIDGLSDVGFLDHERVFSIRQLPRRLAVIGAGPIGCELGQALSRLGSEVTIIDRDARILPREPVEIADHLAKALRSEGLNFHLGSNPVSVEKRGSDKLIAMQSQTGDLELACDELLVAIGRRATVDGLGLETAGISFTPKGIEVNEYLETSQPHVYAVGDCNGGPQFTHFAELEARVATRNALFRGRDKRSMKIIPRVTFTDPEVAGVGMTVEQATEVDEQARAHVVPMGKVDRAVCEGEPEGFLSIVVDRKDRILGAHAVAMGAGEMLAEIVLAMENGISLVELGNAVHAYPTLTRASRRAADERFFAEGVGTWTKRLFGTF